MCGLWVVPSENNTTSWPHLASWTSKIGPSVAIMPSIMATSLRWRTHSAPNHNQNMFCINETGLCRGVLTYKLLFVLFQFQDISNRLTFLPNTYEGSWESQWDTPFPYPPPKFTQFHFLVLPLTTLVCSLFLFFLFWSSKFDDDLKSSRKETNIPSVWNMIEWRSKLGLSCAKLMLICASLLLHIFCRYSYRYFQLFPYI